MNAEIGTPLDIALERHKSFWQSAYPLDPRMRLIPELEQLATQALLPHIHHLEAIPFFDQIPSVTTDVVVATLPPLPAGLNETDESVRLFMEKSRGGILSHIPRISAVLSYQRDWVTGVRPGETTWRRFDTHAAKREFRFSLDPSTSITTIREDHIGDGRWQTLRADMLRASALFLLTDLLTDQEWYKPISTSLNK